MSETSRNQAPKPQDPELTPSQKVMKSLCEDILALKPAHVRLTFEDVVTRTNPDEIQNRLRASSLGDLMLKDSDSLSATPPDDHYPDLDLYVGRAKLVGVGVRAWLWEDDKYRIDPNGPSKPPYDIVAYPGEKDWTHQLDIRLWYSNGRNEACQTVTAQTGSRNAGTLPSFSRDVSAMAYAETGYEGHNQVGRAAQSEEEALGFVALAQELFDARVAHRP